MRLTHDGIVNDINEHGAERLGVKRSEIVGRCLDEYLVPDVSAFIIEKAARFLRDVEASLEFIAEYQLRASPERKVQVLNHWIRVPGDDGGADEIFGIGRTIESGD